MGADLVSAGRWSPQIQRPRRSVPCSGGAGDARTHSFGRLMMASDEAADVHDELIVAAEFERWLRDRRAIA